MNVRKRGLALLMCICMIFTLLPFSALADTVAEYKGGNGGGGGNKPAETSYPLYIGIYIPDNESNTIDWPNEPCVSSKTYRYVIKGNSLGDLTDNSEGKDWRVPYTSNASTCIVPTKDNFVNQYSATQGADGTLGVYNQGGISSDLFKQDFLNDNMKTAIVSAYLEKQNKSNENASDYQLVPYVLKFEKSNEWHLDCVVLPNPSVTLSYDANLPEGASLPTGVGLPNNQTAKGDQDIIINVQNMQYKGDYIGGKPVEVTANGKTYTFAGWSETKDATTPEYDLESLTNGSALITINSDTTLYAVWMDNTPEKYSVTYQYNNAPNGLKAPTDNDTYEEGETVNVLPAATVTGWTFDGWYLDGQKITGNTFEMPGENVTLTGSWTQIEYTVTYNSDKTHGHFILNNQLNYIIDCAGNHYGDHTPAAPTTDPNSKSGVIVPDEGYYFKGWSPAIADKVTDNVTYFAQYAAKKTIEVVANSDEVTYNGEAHSVSGFVRTEFTVDGNTYTVSGLTASVSGTDADEYTNEVKGTAVVKDAAGNDVTAQFTVTTKDGKLTINPRQVTLTSESASKPYDGTPLTRPNVTVSGDGFVEGEVSDIKAIGTVTNISDGEVDNTITYTKNQSFKASNYNITEEIGKLSIVSPDTVVVTIKGNVKTVIYNGEEQTAAGYIVESISSTVYTSADFKLADGSAAEVKAVNAKDTPYYMELTEGSFVNTNPNFDGKVKFVVTDGSLTIAQRPLIIEGESSVPATITYDGQEHSCSKFWAVETDENSGLVLDHKIAGDIKYLLTGKDADIYTGTFTGAAKIMSGDKDVSSNYRIKCAPGEMTIVPAEKIVVKIIGNHKEVTYNGQEQSVKGFEYEVDDETVKVALKEGHYAIATGTDANKTYYMHLSDDDFVVTHDNYNEVSIEIVNGWLKINPRTPVRPPVITDKITVTITGNSDSVVYDGTEHNVKGYTVEISDSRYTEKDFTFSGKDIASGVNAGSYEMGLKSEQFKNTNALFKNVKFVIKADGVLTITPMDLTITAGSKDGIAPVTCNEYENTDLAKGDVIESVKITGEQLEPGQSPNVASDAVIKNAKGEDVTKNYNIKYVDGTLKAVEPLNKEDHFNYIVGYTDGTIRPNNNITRAEVAAIFFRLLTDEARSTFMTDDCSFSDVAQGAWCRRSIATLTNAEIISGYTDGTFKPNAPITRAELATIIARFAKLDVNTKTFSDINGHWAQKYIELAAGNGWIDGYTDGTFRPNQNIKRAETFAMINRVLDRVTKSNSDLLPIDQMNMWSDNMDFDAWYYRDVQEATNNHKAERVGDSIYEKWTEKLPDIDWAAIQL